MCMVCLESSRVDEVVNKKMKRYNITHQLHNFTALFK